MLFEWDEEKNEINIKKHGLDFELASFVFADPNRMEWYDKKHSYDEDRFITIGEIGGTAFVVTVVYTDRGNTIRIISARKATAQERSAYYDC